MGLFGSKTKQLVQKLRKSSEEYSNDLSREIDEQLDELKSDYEENSELVPEFQDFVESIKTKLGSHDAQKLEEFSSRFAKVSRSAKKGVMAMWQLAHSQRKLKSESLMEYDEFE